jgi:hypothetical protein
MCPSHDAPVAVSARAVGFPTGAARLRRGREPDQQVMDESNQPAPTFKLGRSANAHVSPAQRLLVKTIAVFLTEAMDLPLPHRHEVGLFISDPNKPADARVAFGISSLWSFDPKHTNAQEDSPG